MNWFLENWIAMMGLLASPLAYFFGGKQKQKNDTFKAFQEIYDAMIKNTQDKITELTSEVLTLKDANLNIQNQFNNMHLLYAKETELSKHWEKKFKDLEEKYNTLEKDHEKLKKQVQQNTKKA